MTWAPRLVLIGPGHPYKGGIAQHTTALAHRLVEAGADVQVWSWRRQYPARLYPGEQRVPGSVPELLAFAGTTEPLAWDRPLGWFAAGRRARVEGTDAVVLTWTTPVQAAPYLGVLAGLSGGVRRVALCHNVLPHEPSRLDRPLARAVLSRCQGLLVHSLEQAHQARQLAPRAEVRVAALPAPPLPTAGHGAAGTRSLLFFGLVRPYKGLDLLLRALAEPRVPADVRLIVAGEFWTPVREIRAQVDALGLGDRVELRPGYVPAADVPDLFAAADAVVLPYRSGTASVVPDLAHSHGVPVVASRVGTLGSAVRDGVDGLLVSPGREEELADALARLYADGLLARLRAGVRPPDADAMWSAYTTALLGLAVP